jgi:hypothetical protein
MPRSALIESTIRDTPGVDHVTYRYSTGGRPLTLTGIKPADQVHTFRYEGGENVRGSILFVVDYKGRVDFSQSLMMLGKRPPQAWINESRPVMIEIEKRLEQQCHLSNLTALVEERCFGVKCTPE